MGYIGQTIDIDKRWRDHKNNKVDKDHFHNALRCHGPDAFVWRVVIICFDEDMNDYEIEYIKKYNTMKPNGYNLKEGGAGGGKPGPEFGQLISAAKKGRPNGLVGNKLSQETKRKISEAAKGKHKSTEHIQKIADARRGKPNHKRGVPVIQLENGVEKARFPSSSEAGRVTGINYKHIHAVCKGEKWKKTAGGYEWRFVDT